MEKTWVGEVYRKILAKEKKVAERSRDKIPYTTKNGVFDDRGKTEICWWTNGFWGGIMWQLYVRIVPCPSAWMLPPSKTKCCAS